MEGIQGERGSRLLPGGDSCGNLPYTGRRGYRLFAVSTFDTDYIFTKKENFGKALSALSTGGYNVLSPEI